MYHVGREQTVTIGTHTVRLQRFTRAVMIQWHEWARTRLPPVLASILRNFDHFPPECQPALADAAIEAAEAGADFASPQISEVWYSKEGVATLLAFLMKDLDEALAHDLASEAVASGLPVNDWIEKASGKASLSQFELEGEAYREAGLLAKPLGRSRPVDWPSIDRNIFQNVGLTPQQVNEMTLAELSTVMKKEDEVTDSEAHERGLMWHKLTAKQRLQLAIATANN